MFCGNCGNKVNNNERYCEKCGKPVWQKNNVKIQKNNNIVSIIGFVLSLIGVLSFGFLSPLSLIICIIGLVLSKANKRKDKLSIAGIIISILSLVFIIGLSIYVEVTAVDVTIDDFSVKTKSEAEELCKTTQYSCSILEEWSDTVPEGQFIYQSYKAGDVKKSYITLEIKYSKGQKPTTTTTTTETTTTKSYINVDEIKLNKDSINLQVGNTYKVTATILPANASNTNIRWYSSDNSIATVSEDGTITAIKPGAAAITAESGGKKAGILVGVTKKSPIKITKFRYNIDSVCGVQWTFNIKNNSGKTINYIQLKWYNFNGVGDSVYDQISGNNYTALQYTGPLKNGSSTGDKINITKFYNCDYKSSTISYVSIIYDDGTTEEINNSDLQFYTDFISK